MTKLTNWLKKCTIPHEGNCHAPHILRIHAFLGFLSAIVVFEIIFLAVVFVAFPRLNFLSAVLPAVIQEDANMIRQTQRLSPLVLNRTLQVAAQMKADDMAKNHYFAHESPEGKTPWYWIDQAGYDYGYAGENLAINFYDSKDAVDAWMNSPTHRENLLSANYSETGIAMAQGEYEGKEAVFIVQVFASPRFGNESALAKESVSQPTVAANKPALKMAVKTDKPISKPVAKPIKVQPVVATTSLAVNSSVKAESSVATGTTAVLGAAVKETGAITVTTTEKVLQKLSWLKKKMASPRNTLNLVYITIGTIIFLALVLNIFIKIEIQHPQLIINGILLLLIIASTLVLNYYLLNGGAKIA